MTKYIIDGSTLTEIADAIREKTGETETIKPEDMPQKIQDIQTGGGGGGDDAPVESYTSMENRWF